MHLVVAFSLAQEAIPAIRANPGSEWFAWIEIVAAAALTVAAIRELKFRKTEGHESIAWTEIFAGGVLLVEAAIKWREGPRHYPLAVARAVAASLVISLGFAHSRMNQARALTIDDQGIRWRRRLLFANRIDWADLDSVSIDNRVASFKSRSGGGAALWLARLENRDEIANAISAAVAAHGMKVSDTRMIK